ncbi:MAG TPA: DinB family protein [Bryobacteraceae bacterium]|nr:DinB family protein [Bryobacteraceae bacterium]
MNRSSVALLGLALALAGISRAQSNPVLADARADYRSVRDLVIKSAERMPEESFGFKPTPLVRSFGQIIAHIADDQYNLCAPVKNETRQASYTEIEETFTAKADLLAALKKAFVYCDGAYDSITDASSTELVKFGKGQRPKLSMLNWNTWHTWEHYGNLVVYLRIKGLVPPSSRR